MSQGGNHTWSDAPVVIDAANVASSTELSRSGRSCWDRVDLRSLWQEADNRYHARAGEISGAAADASISLDMSDPAAVQRRLGDLASDLSRDQALHGALKTARAAHLDARAAPQAHEKAQSTTAIAVAVLEKSVSALDAEIEALSAQQVDVTALDNEYELLRTALDLTATKDQVAADVVSLRAAEKAFEFQAALVRTPRHRAATTPTTRTFDPES